MKEFWNNRYNTGEYVYGIQPNEFFASLIEKEPTGKLLLLAEGEGRNAVFAAKLGWEITAVDWSENAKAKALALAEKNNVKIDYHTANVIDFVPIKNYYDASALIFAHFDEEEREVVHQKVIDALKPGGLIIIEAYAKEQIGKKSGGPQAVELLYSLEDFVNDFISLDFEIFSKEIIELTEGDAHKGEAVVIRFVGRKKINDE